MVPRRRFVGVLIVDLALACMLGWIGPPTAVLDVAVTDPQRWLDLVGPDAAAVTAVWLLCWIVLLWVTVGLLLIAAASAPSRFGWAADALAARLLPATLRRATMIVLGVSVSTVTLAGTAGASVGHVSGPGAPHVRQVLQSSAGLMGTGPPAAQGVDWPLDPAPPARPGRSQATPRPPDSRAGPDATGDVARPAPLPSRATASTASRGASVPAGVGPRDADRGRSSGRPPTGSQGPATRYATDVGSAHGSASAGPGAERDRVVVRPGNCLWLIAARRLGAGASATDVGREWPRWYAANRRVIGGDPNVIHPGQVLDAPSADTPTWTEAAETPP
jgi:resuscitation-promoting factor RpfA